MKITIGGVCVLFTRAVILFTDGGKMVVETAVKFSMFIFCLSLVLPVHPSTASTPAKREAPETWVYYASDEDGADYAFNPANVERLEGNLVRVSVKTTYPEKNPNYTEGLSQWELNCETKTLRGLTATINKKDGTTAVITQSSDWSPIPAESTAETLFEKICKSKGKKK